MSSAARCAWRVRGACGIAQRGYSKLANPADVKLQYSPIAAEGRRAAFGWQAGETIPGLMVPLEDDLDQVTEFLLVPYAGACIHVPPPPPNQMVYVKMNKSIKVQVTFTDPIQVTGTLKISTVESPYGAVSYDLSGERVDPYQQ